MNNTKALERRFGGRWVGIRFHSGNVPEGNIAERPMRFCEAIAEARIRPITLRPELLKCPGGQRSFGWNTDDEALIITVVDKTGMSVEHARSVITSTPSLPATITGITIGADADPDVLVTFAQPESAMTIINRWQRVRGVGLRAEISTFMAVCGSVAVRAHLTGDLCLSFGCPDSRHFGNITRDRLVVGVPNHLVESLLAGNSNKEAAAPLSRAAQPDMVMSPASS